MLARDSARLNVADRLATRAAEAPHQVAVAAARRGGRGFEQCSFAQLDDDATAIARGLAEMGVLPGSRLALLVKPGVAFVKLVFGLLRSGATTILVDPGMGSKHLANCLAAAEPDGFVAVSVAQAVRIALRRRFPRARFNVTVGRRWFWGGPTLEQLIARGRQASQFPAGGVSDADFARRPDPPSASETPPATHPDDPAAIIFTSGSTGPPKGVLYTHRMFDAQADQIGRQYGIEPGGVDLACFALFGLFNAAWGITTVFPEMDFSRPASADPRKLLAAANQWRVTQAFASPTVWDHLSRHCGMAKQRIPTLRKVFSCGAPVRADVIERTLAHVCTDPAAQMHTPYGATEALPISTIQSREILGETAAKTAQGAGVCVGRKFDGVEWRVIRISDDPIVKLADAQQLPAGEIGELIVRGPQVSPSYLAMSPAPPRSPNSVPAPSAQWGGLGRRVASLQGAPPSPTLPTRGREPEGLDLGANALSKIADGQAVWHRMGDVGYLDEAGRFWYCGRKSQRVETAQGTLCTECVEGIFNHHPLVVRSALVGCGPPGQATAALIVQANQDVSTAEAREALSRLSNDLEAISRSTPMTDAITAFLCVNDMPVDVRHNAKINREALAAWAAKTLASAPTPTSPSGDA